MTDSNTIVYSPIFCSLFLYFVVAVAFFIVNERLVIFVNLEFYNYICIVYIYFLLTIVHKMVYHIPFHNIILWSLDIRPVKVILNVI